MYRKATANPTTGQQTPLAYTPIEDADISKATNRFTSNTGITYDEAGNVVADNKFRAMSFSYDANGRMVKATKANVPDALSVYDASGQRVAERVNDVWKFFIYDTGGKMVAEYGGLQATDEGGIKYVFTDWQGSTRAITSNTGFIQSRTDYTAFGEEINSGVGQRTTAQGFEAANTLNQKYALTERDKATGLDHTWFRKLENRAGRWTSPDPYNGSMSLGNPQSFNRYAYVGNDPVNYVDPSGLNASFGFPSWWNQERWGAEWGGGDHFGWSGGAVFWGGDFGEALGGGGGGSLLPGINTTGYYSEGHWVMTGFVVIHAAFAGSPAAGTAGGAAIVEEPTKPTKSQCDAIKELLRREQEYGTNAAAYMSAEETGKTVSNGNGGTTRLTALRNEFNGILWIGASPLDADWILTLYATRTKSGKGTAKGAAAVGYAVGKTIWSIGKLITGQEAQNPIPFTEAAERNAVWYAEAGYKFKEIFTEDWLKENCD